MAPDAAGKTPTAQQQQVVDQIAERFLQDVDKPNATLEDWSNAKEIYDPGYRKMFGNDMYKDNNVEAATASLNGEAK